MVTSLRFLSAPLFFYTFINGQFPLYFLLALFAGATDIADGYLARKMNATSDLGAYLDVGADFVLILFSFLAFILVGWYPWWVMGIAIFMFFLFIVTSGLKKPIYDPVGKYLGTYLMGMVILSVLFPETFFRHILLVGLFFMALTSIISRILFFLGLDD